jgi:hypothetical protein
MTNKDFDLIAATLKAERERLYTNATLFSADINPEQLRLLNALAHDFANRLKATNKQFNRDKFPHACGVSP